MRNLQLLRMNAGLSQTALGRKVKTTRTEISKLENGWYTRIPDRIYQALQAVFGTDWTREALMQEVAAPTPLTSEEAPGDSPGDELRKAS
jgi:transcriptional regulator with XRE-family HTH domain